MSGSRANRGVTAPKRRVRSGPAALVLLLALPAFAVIPRFWETATYDEFHQGELEGLSITGDGELVLAPDFDMVFDTGEALVVSVAVDSSGTVYLGTGHDGRVFAVDAGGNGRMLLDLDELDVLAMAVDGDDTLFVGTSPNGRVYRVDPDGTPRMFFDPGAVYIWAMAFDREGRLLVGTGDEGIIYRVDPSGRGEILYDSEETHIMTLALAGNGDIVAGGDPKGYLYRISEDGRPFVLHDSGMREVHAVAVAEDGTIYAAVVNGDGSGGSSGSTASGSAGAATAMTIGISVPNSRSAAAQTVVVAGSGASSAPTGGGVASRGSSGAPRGMILEVGPDASIAPIWESSDEMVFSLLPVGDRLLFSTGTRGRIYEYDTPRRAALLVESTEEQTTRLIAAGGRVFAASSNAGKLFEVGDTGGDFGRYTSIVRDTASVSTWGKVSWSGSGVEILTRSGNTESPGPTWSDWTRVSADGTVSSPRARFIQWRAELDRASGNPPRLASLTLPYLEQNVRPEVRSVDVLRPGVALREAQPAAGVANGPNNNNRGPTSGRVEPVVAAQAPRSVVDNGAQALRWTAEDDNDDDLVYSIFYRSDSQTEWKPLVEGLGEPFYTIEADTLPDGMYTMRVVASDIGSNPSDTALEGAYETRLFSIDNTPPVVAVELAAIEGGRARVRVGAEDRTSVLKQAQVSVDAGVWVPVFPLDGIADSTRESFDFLSPLLGAGEHVVAVRIYDQNDNVGIGATIVQIP